MVSHQISIAEISRPNNIYKLYKWYNPVLSMVKAVRYYFSPRLLVVTIKALLKCMDGPADAYLFVSMIRKIMSVVRSMYEFYSAAASGFRLNIGRGLSWQV